MKKLHWLVLTALLAVLIYFINVEVQTRMGSKALAETGIDFVTLEDARDRVVAKGVPVLIYVAAIWCPSCRRFDREVLSDPQVREELNHWSVVRLEYESADGERFQQAQKAIGFPNLFVMDGSGSVAKVPIEADAATMLEVLRKLRLRQVPKASV